MRSEGSVRAVITGGSSGIGHQVARCLSEAGAEVLITGRDLEELHAAATSIGARALPLNLNDTASVHLFFKELGNRSIDVFVANAGSVERNADDQAEQTAGALSVLAGAARLLAPGGVLAVTNTLFTQFPADQVPDEFKAYVHGKRQLTTCLAELCIGYPELRILDVALGFVDGTKGLTRIKTPDEAEAYKHYMASVTPGGKLTTAGEAGRFIFDVLHQPSSRVRVGIDGSTIALAELTGSSPSTP